MPTFSYKIRDARGRVQKGKADADSSAALINELRGRGWLILSVKEAAGGDIDLKGLLKKLSPGYWTSPKVNDVTLSLQQLAMMMRSGITLLNAIQTISEQAEKPSMGRIWAKVALSLQDGVPLADSMQQHKCFGSMVIQMIRIGETSGNLEAVLTQAANTLERRKKIVGKLISALMYPVFTFILAIAVATFMVVKVIPELQKVVQSMGKDVPAMTQMILDFSDLLNNSGFKPLIVVGGVLACFVGLYNWSPSRMLIDRSMLLIPIIGKLLRVASTAAFSRSMSILLNSGVSLIEALRATEDLNRNKFLARCVALSRQGIIQGGELGPPLAKPGGFMPMLAKMVSVGEASGNLEFVLEEVANFHDVLMQATIEKFTAAFEILVILMVGLIVGFVYVSFFMLMFSF